MCSDHAVVIDGLSKCYHIYERPGDRLKQMVKQPLWRLFGKTARKNDREFWALKNISLKVKKGETVGIVGRNGAGKSTLLQLICGTLAPTAGTITVSGRISALLELGAGFNPEFTGRENVFIYGSVLGLDHEEIKARFDDIVAFADIGDFLDQPIKTYSSGMFVRLAFAVSICVDPDILIVDEALAVGDVKFQAKCFRHFETLVASGKTIIFVTHSTEQIVRHCSWAVLLDNGEILSRDKPKVIENLYLDLLFGAKRSVELPADGDGVEKRRVSPHTDVLLPIETAVNYNSGEYRWGNREAEIIGFHMAGAEGEARGSIQSGEAVHVTIDVRFHRDVALPIFGLTIKTPDGIIIYGSNSRDFIGGPLIRPCQKGELVRICFEVTPHLGAGDYFLSLGVVEQANGELIPLDRRYDVVHFHVMNDGASFGLVDMGMDIRFV